MPSAPPAVPNTVRATSPWQVLAWLGNARQLQQHAVVREHRRLLGYPAILAVADAMGTDGMLLDAHCLHLVDAAHRTQALACAA